MFTDFVKTTLLFCCTRVILNKTHAYKRIMANYHYFNKVNPNQESRYCDIKTHLCDPVGIGLIKTFENISDGKSCHRLCETDSKCKFTTFTFFRKEPRCFILSNCDRQVIFPKRKRRSTTFIMSVLDSSLFLFQVLSVLGETVFL